MDTGLEAWPTGLILARVTGYPWLLEKEVAGLGVLPPSGHLGHGLSRRHSKLVQPACMPEVGCLCKARQHSSRAACLPIAKPVCTLCRY